MKSSIVVALLVGSFLAFVGYKAGSEPFINQEGDTVYVRHQNRTYTVTYKDGKRFLEVLEDRRDGHKCAARVEVGHAYAMYYGGCDPAQVTGMYPVMALSIEELQGKKEILEKKIDLRPFIDGFAELRPMADAHHVP